LLGSPLSLVASRPAVGRRPNFIPDEIVNLGGFVHDNSIQIKKDTQGCLILFGGAAGIEKII